MTFTSALIIAIIAGLIAIYGRILAVRRTEYYRLRVLLKTAFQDTILNLHKTEEHPATLVENSRIDTLIADILRVMPFGKRKRFVCQWKEYRYDKEIQNIGPREYTQKSPDVARKIIADRLHNLISNL